MNSGVRAPLVVDVRPAAPEVPDAALVRECPGKYRGPFNTTRDFVKRGDVAEAALEVCRAQVRSIREWRATRLQAVASPATN